MSEQSTDLRQNFIDAMSLCANSVCVVSTDGAAGLGGLTVSAMSSVSADPDDQADGPTMLICVHANSTSLPLILENGVFCINILGQDDDKIAEIFAGRHGLTGSARFEGIRYAPLITGAPVFADALAAFDCTVLKSETIGTHHVIFGVVRGVTLTPQTAPLIYHKRRFRALAPEATEGTGHV